jgi:hypothetical protein
MFEIATFLNSPGDEQKRPVDAQRIEIWTDVWLRQKLPCLQEREEPAKDRKQRPAHANRIRLARFRKLWQEARRSQNWACNQLREKCT